MQETYGGGCVVTQTSFPHFLSPGTQLPSSPVNQGKAYAAWIPENLGASGDLEVLMIPMCLGGGRCPAALATAQEDTAVFKGLRSLQNNKVLLSQCYKWLNHEAKYNLSNEACGHVKILTWVSKVLRKFCQNLCKQEMLLKHLSFPENKPILTKKKINSLPNMKILFFSCPFL